jgi:drug/metabolite transporter (DMT)-like permease
MAVIGSFVVSNKIIVKYFPVFLASELRLLVGAAILLFLLFRQEKKIPSLSKRDAGIFFIQSFIGVFLFSIFMLTGLNYTTALEAGIITSLTPAFVGLISYFFLKEVLDRKQLAGITLAILGTLFINVFGMRLNIGLSYNSLYGNLLITGAVIGEAVFITFGKLASKELSALTISAMMSTISAILFLPLALSDALAFNFSAVPGAIWLLVLYSGVIVTVWAVLLMNQSLTIIPSGTAAVFTAIMPISAVVLSCIILKETFYWYHLVGIFFTLAGVILITKK